MEYRFLMILLVLLVMLSACSQDSAPLQVVEATMPPEATELMQDAPHLKISLTPEDNAYKALSEELPEDLTEFSISYIGVNNVMITLGNEQIPLEDALTSGRITPEEIIAYAQLDANNGYCYEYPVSTNGLTKLVYNYYDQFDLVVFYDVYETPDGNQHLIKKLNFCPYYDGRRISFGFGELDRENWGLTIQPAEITPEGLTLTVTQFGGQQIGGLRIVEYAIISRTEQETRRNSDGNIFVNLEDLPEYRIQMNGESSIQINWSADYGNLPAGDYTIWLNILDVYDESQVHPLMKNYQDLQGHYIDFPIP